MAFENISEKLQGAFKKLTNRGRLSEKDIKEAMREIKLALLEADVNFSVVKSFIKDVSARAVDQTVLESLTPGQQVIKIVNEEMTRLMGGSLVKLNTANTPPSVYMMCGLQGSGKTTMSGKLANLLKGQGRKPLLVACDIYRPAAIDQLQVVGKKVGVPVYEKGTQNPVDTAKQALRYAKDEDFDIVIIDTAGRLHIDEALMQELKSMEQAVKPNEVLLVVDAMTGQDAVNVAESFNNDLGITGVLLTKLDGDTRGGAALSVKAVTGQPIKYCGVGEKLSDIEPFHPDRMAGRILGMGDMLSLIEKAEQAFDEKQARALEEKMRTQRFTFNDFLDQMQQLKKMGSMSDVLGMLPGANMGKLADAQVDEKQMARTEAIVYAMTPAERETPHILNGSRRKRIAKGSGTTIQDVNRLLNQFESMQKMMKQLTGGGGKRFKKGRMNLPFGI